MNTATSDRLFEKAQALIPGGVNSPVRACASVGGHPLFISRGEKSRIYDEDGNSYIDYIQSWGPLILGHCPKEVVESLEKVIARGTSFGTSTELEIQLAEIMVKMLPGLDMVRMVNSGTEATMSAVRLARGFTGRDIIIKFDGCYHGHADTLLVAAGSGVADLAIPGSPGIPASISQNTMSLPYNDGEAFSAVMDKMGDKIAGVIVEPVAGNMGMIRPVKGFLETLREKTQQHGSLLIFDEVMTGFRVDKGCAQGLFNIDPDLSTFGKVIGGGLPVAAFGGKREIMNQMAPAGPVYQAGTLSGNPLAMAAGVATLTRLREKGVYETLNARTRQLMQGLQSIADDAGLPLQTDHFCSMAGFFFTDKKVQNFADAKQSNVK
ncbi:MAG: glutamate-1-semialdehyde-2,1-aminomutase, partial [Deltaproteobacteria bacterium]